MRLSFIICVIMGKQAFLENCPLLGTEDEFGLIVFSQKVWLLSLVAVDDIFCNLSMFP